MRNPATAASPTSVATTATRNNNGSKTTPCCSKVGMKRGPWTPEEDELLATYIKKEGEGRWRTLPKRAGLPRCGKSCRLRWMNYLRPSVKRGQITPDEEDLILRLHRLLGNRWSLIAGRIPGRTDNEIKNYWNTHLSKKLISQGIDPRTHKPLNPPDQFNSPPTHNNLKPSSSSSSSKLANRGAATAAAISTPNNVPIISTTHDSDSSSGGQIMVARNKENEYFQNINYPADDHGFTGLHNCCNGTSGIEMIIQNQQGISSNNEEDEDINYCTDDVFSSFLNSLINEDDHALTCNQQNQFMQHHNNEEIITTAATTSFSLCQDWESPMIMSSNLINQNDPKRVVNDHLK